MNLCFHGTSIGEVTMRRMLLTLSTVFALVAFAAGAGTRLQE